MDARGQVYFDAEENIPDADKKRLEQAELDELKADLDRLRADYDAQRDDEV